MKDATAWYQRAGLLVSNNAVYVGYTYVSDDTLSTQHGFVQSFQADDLSVRLASWESSPTTPHGGVWQAGRGLAADGLGNLYIVTADGEWNGTTDFGNSAVQLTPRTLGVGELFYALELVVRCSNPTPIWAQMASRSCLNTTLRSLAASRASSI